MRTALQRLLIVIALILSSGCVRSRNCVVEDTDEDASRVVNTTKSFIFDSFDQNVDRQVDLNEFRERIAIKFGYLDLNQNGRIDLGAECRDNKWCTPFLAKGKSLVTISNFLDEAVRSFKEVEKNGDEMLDHREFSKLPTD